MTQQKDDTGPQLAIGKKDPLPEEKDSRPVTPRENPSDALARLGAAFSSLSQAGQAISFYQQALEGYQASGDQPGEASTLANLAGAYWQQRDTTSAIQAWLAASFSILSPGTEARLS